VLEQRPDGGDFLSAVTKLFYRFSSNVVE
jgi:hypothetical protein